MSRLSGSFDLAIARPETDTGLILPFNEADPKLYQASSVVNTSSIDTSKWDEYRQGVEIVTEAHMMKGTVKVHSGEPGHWLPQTAFGMSLQTSSRRLIAFSDQIRLPPTVSEPTPTPPVPVVSNRYDNSAALLWYKCSDAATPLVNSGDGGSRDLAYDPTSDGPATFGAAGIFDTDTAIELNSTFNFERYWINSPADVAWFATNRATLWAWVTIPSAALQNGWTFGGYDSGDVNNPACRFLTALATPAVAIQFRFQGVGLMSAYLNPGPTFDVPHLWAGTYDGVAVRMYLDGLEVGTQPIVGTLEPPANLQWAFGAPGAGGNNCNATVYDCGFDNTCYSAATLLDMYNTAGV